MEFRTYHFRYKKQIYGKADPWKHAKIKARNYAEAVKKFKEKYKGKWGRYVLE